MGTNTYVGTKTEKNLWEAYPLHGEFNTKMRAELKERRANKNV